MKIYKIAQIKAYHGTKENFEIFDDAIAASKGDHSTSQLGHFFTTNRNEALQYGDKIMEAYLSLRKPHITTWKDIKEEDGYDLKQKLISQGYDGVLIRDGKGSDWYVVFTPSQIQTTEP